MVEIKSLTFQYGAGRALFNRLDLDLEPGKVYGLLGKNGAGKTSLLKLMCGLRYAHGGMIAVGGRDASKRERAMLQDIYLLPEEIPLYRASSERLAALRAPFYPRFDRDMHRDLLKEFDIDPTKSLATLSHGQRKKAVVAFGLATNCRLMLLDEPTNGMDIPSKGLFRKLVARSVSEDRCLVISTHQVRDVEHLIDTVAIIEAGMIVYKAGLDRVSATVGITADPPSEDAVLYAEDMPTGRRCLVPTNGSALDQVDLEFLFNAVIANPVRMAEALAKGGNA